MVYSKAPISEVICGVFFQNQVFSIDEIMTINMGLSGDYPLIEVLPPLITEQLVGSQLQTSIGSLSAGPILYRRRTKDKKWLIQLQQNALYLNWVREDSEAVGDYPGFDYIFMMYKQFLGRVCELIGRTISFEEAVLDLTYHNRVDFNEMDISSYDQIGSIVRMSIPSFGSVLDTKTIFSKTSYKIDGIKGYGILTINNNSKPERGLFNYELILRGKMDTSFDDWFAKSRQIEDSCFESFFKGELLEKWK